MSNSNFYRPNEIRPLYGEIVPAYQAAFAGEPWYEVSKCADQFQRCVGGLSSLVVGAACDLCGNCPALPAYEADELVMRFESLAVSRPTTWYVEQNSVGVTLAAIAWKAEPKVIASEKYSDVPVMEDWLNEELGSDEVMWLDEVFANKELKPKGNLRNFGKFVTGLAEMLDTTTVAYRTINPAMIWQPMQCFGRDARVYAGEWDRSKLRRSVNISDTVPDRRDFIAINLGK